VMRVLLDENLPRKLKSCFSPNIEVATVPEHGWSGMKNGALLRAAAEEFDVFISMDFGLAYQQNLRGVPLGVILISAVSNRYQDLLPLMPRINEVLTTIQPGTIIRISAEWIGDA
jgi:hypothetical protein